MAGAEMPIMINPAGKNIVIDRAAPPLEPGQQAGPSVLEQFELTSASHSAPLAMALDRPYTYTRELATFQLTHSWRNPNRAIHTVNGWYRWLCPPWIAGE